MGTLSINLDSKELFRKEHEFDSILVSNTHLFMFLLLMFDLFYSTSIHIKTNL